MSSSSGCPLCFRGGKSAAGSEEGLRLAVLAGFTRPVKMNYAQATALDPSRLQDFFGVRETPQSVRGKYRACSPSGSQPEASPDADRSRGFWSVSIPKYDVSYRDAIPGAPVARRTNAF